MKVKNEWWSVIEAAKKDLWLPQVTLLLVSGFLGLFWCQVVSVPVF